MTPKAIAPAKHRFCAGLLTPQFPTGAKVEYSWNHANLLTGIVCKSAINVVTKSVRNRYDGLGRRIQKSVDDNGNGTVDRTESYLYDGAGLLASPSRPFSPGTPGEKVADRPDERYSAAKMRELVFHDPLHMYGTEDDMSKGVLINAHMIDNMINSRFRETTVTYMIQEAQDVASRVARQ